MFQRSVPPGLAGRLWIVRRGSGTEFGWSRGGLGCPLLRDQMKGEWACSFGIEGILSASRMVEVRRERVANGDKRAGSDGNSSGGHDCDGGAVQLGGVGAGSGQEDVCVEGSQAFRRQE